MSVARGIMSSAASPVGRQVRMMVPSKSLQRECVRTRVYSMPVRNVSIVSAGILLKLVNM